MSLSVLARTSIKEIESFTPEKPIEEIQSELGLEEIAGLSCNENPLGPSPKAQTAMGKEIAKGQIYPDESSTLLRQKLAGHFGIAPDEIILGNGADNILTMIAQAFINDGEEAVLAFPTFPVYENVVKIMGGRIVRVPLKNHVHDLPGMLAAITPRTKLVFVCNPNNPTGTVVSRDEAADFLCKVPDHCLVVWDEAYAEYVDKENDFDMFSFMRQKSNLILVRTFSKIYGLAGERVGYAMGSKDLISTLSRVVEPFAVNRLAQAGALAALEDSEFVDRVKAINEEGKQFLYREYTRLGLPFVPSQTNFILVDLKTDAKTAAEKLLAEGILIRPGGGWALPTWARITVGAYAQNVRLIHALADLTERK